MSLTNLRHFVRIRSIMKAPFFFPAFALAVLIGFTPPIAQAAETNAPTRKKSSGKKKKAARKKGKNKKTKTSANDNQKAVDAERERASRIKRQEARKIQVAPGPKNSEATQALAELVFNGQDDADTAGKLITEGADVNARLETGDPLLWFTAFSGKNKIAARLIEAGADVDAPNAMADQTALMRAIRAQNTEMVSLLLDAGADPNKKDKHGYSVVAYAGEYKSPVKVWQKLLDAGADITEHSLLEGAPTPLLWNVMRSDAEVVAWLLKHGASPETGVLGDSEQTPLKHAVDNNDAVMVRLLVDAGADINKLAPEIQSAAKALLKQAGR